MPCGDNKEKEHDDIHHSGSHRIPGPMEPHAVGEKNPLVDEVIEPKKEKKPKPPRGNSPRGRGVFGRDKEIERISKSLQTKPIAVVYGIRGIGKSKLIEEVRRKVTNQNEANLQVTIDSGMNLDELFRQMARFLGCRAENTKSIFKKLIGEGYDFSKMKEYAKSVQPGFIHIIDAHLFIDQKKQSFYDEGILEFLKALTVYYPGMRVVLESRERLRSIFSGDICEVFPVIGIDMQSMNDYFRSFFKDRLEGGWELKTGEDRYVFQCLGGPSETEANQRKDGAHPMAMMLLANVAEGLNINPAEVLRGLGRKTYDEQLESELFGDLYTRVLSATEKHLLRLSALYREGIPDSHINHLENRVGEPGVFFRVVERCLIEPNAMEEWYFLHALISELTRLHIEKGIDVYYDDHKAIADAWSEKFRNKNISNLPTIKATNEGFYHLFEAQEYGRFYELSDQMLRKDVVPHLAELSNRLSNQGKHSDNKPVLELLVRLVPDEPRYHRFLAGTIEKLEGEGNDMALFHFQEAFRLRPGFPQHLADLGRCYLDRNEPEKFIQIVENIPKEKYKAVMDDHNLAIYAGCLERTGEAARASEIRTERIDAGSKHAAFYNDEAKYLLSKGQYDPALDIIGKAEERKCTDNFTYSIKASVLEAMKDETGASALRNKHIDAGSKHAAFYNDEAKYLLSKGQYDEALEIIGKAEKAGCADAHIISVKASVLEAKGDETGASALRMSYINAGSKTPVFYNDEANYLFNKSKIENAPNELHDKELLEQALELLDRARETRCEDDYTRTIRAKIERFLYDV